MFLTFLTTHELCVHDPPQYVSYLGNAAITILLHQKSKANKSHHASSSDLYQPSPLCHTNYEPLCKHMSRRLRLYDKAHMHLFKNLYEEVVE